MFFDCGAIARVPNMVKDRSLVELKKTWAAEVQMTCDLVGRLLAPRDDGPVQYRGREHIRLFHNTTGAVQRVLMQIDREYAGTHPSLLTTDLEYPGCVAAIDDVWGGSVMVAELAADLMSATARGLRADSWLEAALMRAYNYVRPRVVYLSHVMRTTGQLISTDVLQYMREANPRVVIILDGCQALGNVLVPEELLKLVDFYVTSGHKWLGGMTTSGFVWIREPGKWKLADPAQSTTYAEHQGGTGNAAALLSLNLSIAEMLNDSPVASRISEIARHNQNLASSFCRSLGRLSGQPVRVITPTRERHVPSGLVTVAVRQGGVGEFLAERGFTCTTLHGESILRTFHRSEGAARVRVIRLADERAPRIEPVDLHTASPPEPALEHLRFCFHHYHSRADVSALSAAIRDAVS